MNRKPSIGTSMQRQVLALLLFALFFAPSLIQALHHHEHEGSPLHSNHSGWLTKYEHCAICSFEFVSFLKSEPTYTAKAAHVCLTVPAELVDGPVVPCFLILAGRAPPLS